LRNAAFIYLKQNFIFLQSQKAIAYYPALDLSPLTVIRASLNGDLHPCIYNIYTVKKYCWFNLKKVSNLVALKF